MCTLFVSVVRLIAFHNFFHLFPVVQPLILTIDIRVAALGYMSYTGQTYVYLTYLLICLFRVKAYSILIVHLQESVVEFDTLVGRSFQKTSLL